MLLLAPICIVTAFLFAAGLVWEPLALAIFIGCALVYWFFDDTPPDVG